MRIRTVLITGDFKEGNGDSDLVDIHCLFSNSFN